MNNQHVKGGVNEIKGKVKEEVGHLTGDKSMASSGVFDQVKGKVQKGLGDFKDAVKKGVDTFLEDKDTKKSRAS